MGFARSCSAGGDGRIAPGVEEESGITGKTWWKTDSHPATDVLQECWERQREHVGWAGLNWESTSVHVQYLLEFKSKEKGQIDLVSAFRYHIVGNMLIVCRYIDGTKEPHIGVTGCTSKGSRNRGNMKCMRGLCSGEAVSLGRIEMGGRDKQLLHQAGTHLN